MLGRLIAPGSDLATWRWLRDILEDMGWLPTGAQLQMPETRPTLVMDRGLATSGNLKLLREERLPYIVIERCGRQSEYTDLFTPWPEGFERVTKPGREDVWVQKVEGPDEKTARVLCKSEARREKEKAIAERWTGRAQDDLRRLAKSVARGYVRDLDKVHQRIGRLKERYVGFDKHFAVEVEPDPRNEKKAAAIHWERLAAREKQSETLTGCYVIETTHTHRAALDIWGLYMTLTRVESAFRGLKSDLGTRPIFHQLASRTKGHLFSSVLAYHLLNYIEHQLARSGDHRRWFKVRDVLSTHRRATIILTDEQGVVHHIRHSGETEPAHADIYDSLGVKDPTTRNHYEVGRV